MRLFKVKTKKSGNNFINNLNVINKKKNHSLSHEKMREKLSFNFSMIFLSISSVYISVSTADGNALYSKKISGSKFKPNGKETKYTYKEKSPKKHKDTLFPFEDKITCNIKKATIGDITESTKDIKVRITVGSKTYEVVNTWTVKDSKKKIKLIFKQ